MSGIARQYTKQLLMSHLAVLPNKERHLKRAGRIQIKVCSHQMHRRHLVCCSAPFGPHNAEKQRVL
jgi:hypothetical protein